MSQRERGVKTGRYQEKKQQGLVPHQYDRDSQKFLMGAWRHWPEDRMSRLAKGMERVDRETLRIGREAR